MSGPLSIAQTRELLESLGHHPRKNLGQNFLIDGNIVRKSLEMAKIGPGDVVIEIGPGLGTLTSALADAGAEVHAVELDKYLAAYIREKLGDRIHLTEGDAVQFPLGDLSQNIAGMTAPPPWKIVANLPYAVTSTWLEAVLEGPLPERMVLMMQKEAADRLSALHGSKSFGAISIFLQSAYEPLFRHRVSRQCFYPVPGVDSMLAGWIRRAHPVTYPEPIRRDIRHLFTQRRKQLQSLTRGHPIFEPWFARNASRNLSPTARAEEVPLPIWQQLANPE
jgi:16S rRNA (adenine1518-N6/adenine1519-N6)-dimethyltransferase